MTTTPDDQPDDQNTANDETFGDVVDEGYGVGVEDPATGLVDQDDMNINVEDPTRGSNDDLDEGHGVATGQ